MSTEEASMGDPAVLARTNPEKFARLIRLKNMARHLSNAAEHIVYPSTGPSKPGPPPSVDGPLEWPSDDEAKTKETKETTKKEPKKRRVRPSPETRDPTVGLSEEALKNITWGNQLGAALWGLEEDGKGGGADDTEPKMYIVVDKDIAKRMGRGKFSGQVAHGACGWERKLVEKPTPAYRIWRSGCEPKIVLAAPGELLLKLRTTYPNDTIEIRDAGRTQIPAGTLTVVAFQPIAPQPIELKGLKLL